MGATYDPSVLTARDRLRHDLFDMDVSYAAGQGIGSIVVVTPGTGYTSSPTVTLTGVTPATVAAAHALLDGAGGIAAVVIDSAGSGYTSIPTVVFGGPGTGAVATALYATNALLDDVTYDAYITLYGEDEAKWRIAASFLAQYSVAPDNVTTDDGTHVAWRARVNAWEAIVKTWDQFAGSLRRGLQEPLVGAISTTAIISTPYSNQIDANDQRFRGSAYVPWRGPNG